MSAPSVSPWRGVLWLAGMVVVVAAGPVAAQSQPARDTVIREAGAPKQRGVARLIPELSIGTVDGGIEYTFQSVTDIVPLRDGSVLVMDGAASSDPMLRQYDARGKYVRTVGRRGQGPGEYTGVGGVTQLPDGRILVLDAAGRRLNVYTADGAVADTWRLPNFMLSMGGTGRLRADAGLIHLHTDIRGAGASAAESMRNRRAAVIRLRPTGAILDTILAPDLPHADAAAVSRTHVVGNSSSTTSVDVPYIPQALWAWSPRGYLITGMPRRYAFELRLPPSGASRLWREGDPVISVRRAARPIPVSREERADQRAYVERQLDAPGQLSRAIPDVPDVKPAYKRFLVGNDGRIWVALSTSSEKYDPETAPPPTPVGISIGRGSTAAPPAPPRRPPWRESALFDVFEPDGTYVGQVAVPFDTRVVVTNGATAWGVVTDQLGVQYVRRFRIAWDG